MGRLLNLAFLLPILVLFAVGFAIWGWSVQAAALNYTVLDIIYNAIHAVTLSTSYASAKGYNYDWRIDVARILGTIAFLMAATQAIRRLLSYQASRYFGRFRSGHLLVIGDHPVARSIAQAAAGRRAMVTWIAHAETDEHAIPGALIVPQRWDRRLADSFSAARASRCVVAFANEVEQIAAVRDVRTAAPALPITMNFGDAWFAERMDELENISGVRFVSQVQLAVRDLHWRQPPFMVASRLGHRRLHALIFGMGRGGEAVLNDLLLSSLTGFLGKPKITIVDPRADEVRASLDQRCPALGDSADIEVIDPGNPVDIRVLPVRALAHAARQDPISLAYVCVDDDLRAVALAVSLQALARREGWQIGPICTSMQTGGALPDTLAQAGAPESAGLMAFGATQDFANAIGLFDTEHDALPRLFHEAYRRTAPDHAVANTPWEGLAEELRESNRRLLIHVPAKLATAGVDVMAWIEKSAMQKPAADVPLLPDITRNPALLEQLAELEHDRWMMERRLSGWQYGPRRDNGRRHHPDLKPYAELADATKQFDRAMVLETWMALRSSTGGGFAPDGSGVSPITRDPIAAAAE